MKRRRFMQSAGAAAGGCVFSSLEVMGREKASSPGSEGLPRRLIGKTDIKASIVGFPGLALIHHEQAECNEHIKKAFAAGVNYFDVAPAYGRGDAEIKMGIGLQGLDRKKYYLASKTKMRDAKGAREELERSLKRLKTDYFDVYQLHCLKTHDDVEKALGPGGAMETILKAKKEGKLRYIGFSAHTTKSALKAMHAFRFDTVMFPINFVEMFKLGFGKPVLELAQKQGAGVLAIKPLCGGAWPKGVKREPRRWWYRPLEAQKDIDLAFRFTLSQVPVAVGFPPAFTDLLFKMMHAARHYSPVGKDEIPAIQDMAGKRLSVFEREEKSVSCLYNHDETSPVYPESPHDGCSDAFV